MIRSIEACASPPEIYFGALSADTQRAIAEWLASHGDFDSADRKWWDFAKFCGLWFRLRAMPDSADLFPRGKWATLQRMQDVIDNALSGRPEGFAR